MDTEKLYDYILVGGGTTACVLTSKLLTRRSSLSILVVEAGQDVSEDPRVSHPQYLEQEEQLHFSEIDYQYYNVPQVHLDNKPRYNCAVKAVSGTCAINQGAWIRGDALDYDEWASLAKDSRWSYNSLLPYFRRTEHHYDPDANPDEHGFDGPIHTISVWNDGRKYPLRDTVLQAWKSLGLEHIPDLNNGHPLGIAEEVSCKRNGARQLANVVYPLEGATFLTNTVVSRIILSDTDHGKTAVGIELADKSQRKVKAGGEVIVCAGVFGSPQILMLSGIGDKSQLQEHNIPLQVDLPSVGKELADHLGSMRYWKLRHPEKELAHGSPKFEDPIYQKGSPSDWLVTASVPSEGLKAALAKDLGGPVSDDHPFLKSPRSHIEMDIMYTVSRPEGVDLSVPVDGSAIMTYFFQCLPTSRGTVRLSSPDPRAAPIIDPNHYATEVDRFVFRHAWRMQAQLMQETPEGRDLVAHEIRPDGDGNKGWDESDADIDERLKAEVVTMSQGTGTCSMGKVVDGECKVYGVSGLRVADASVIPLPLSAHLLSPLLALGEVVADMIAAGWKKTNGSA